MSLLHKTIYNYGCVHFEVNAEECKTRIMFNHWGKNWCFEQPRHHSSVRCDNTTRAQGKYTCTATNVFATCNEEKFRVRNKLFHSKDIIKCRVTEFCRFGKLQHGDVIRYIYA